MSTTTTSAGFIGLGNIGKPMALRLAADDTVAVTVYDIAPEPLAELEKAGAAVAASVAALAATSDVICVMVQNDAQVRDVLAEILTTARPGTVVAVHSTVEPGTPAELAITAGRHDVDVLDAPVSGGFMGAADGRLAIMVGGPEQAFERARPVFDVLGQLVVRVGDAGDGTRFKLARNMMHFVAYTAATEAQRLAEAAGLDIKVLGEVVRFTDQVTGGPGAIMHRDTTAPIQPDEFWMAPFSHTRVLGEKDLSLAIDLAGELGVEVPLAELSLQRFGPGLGLPDEAPTEPRRRTVTESGVTW